MSSELVCHTFKLIYDLSSPYAAELSGRQAPRSGATPGISEAYELFRSNHGRQKPIMVPDRWAQAGFERSMLLVATGRQMAVRPRAASTSASTPPIHCAATAATPATDAADTTSIGSPRPSSCGFTTLASPTTIHIARLGSRTPLIAALNSGNVSAR